MLPITERVRYSPNGLLRMYNLDEKDAGEYECVATNIAGTGSGIATLNYIGKYISFTP